MEIYEAATEPRWWNTNTTLAEVARRYSEHCALTPAQRERYVTAMGACFNGETLAQAADRFGDSSDMDSVYDFFVDEGLCGTEVDYYTEKQVARHAIKLLYFDPGQPDSQSNAFISVQTNLRWLIKHCAGDEVRLCALRAAERAMGRLLGDEFQAVLRGIAGIELRQYWDDSHLESDEPVIPDGWGWGWRLGN